MNERQKTMQMLCELVGRGIAAELADTTTGPPMGFMLMLFDFEGDKRADKFAAYISNAERADMIRLLREQANRLEAGMTTSQGQA